jgi:hypothetical protein
MKSSASRIIEPMSADSSQCASVIERGPGVGMNLVHG